MKPTAGTSVLDLGSGWGDPLVARIAERVPLEVTLADVSEGPLEDGASRGFRAVVLKEGEPLPFKPNQFDIVLSNSVIEHVTMSPDECRTLSLSEREWRRHAIANQRRFANEIRRVGKRYFVQTPHKHFPIDLHLWLPGTNWLPHDIVRRMVPWLDKHWIKKAGVADWHLLGPREMGDLFPDAEIAVARLLGVPKSVIAYR
ncbi:MAG: class I SAM-dependent methyltransferase [Gemmatimonadetes bacterium]|nr:class I SAM-dependent methyltransferase [Gemmatimonadota bacterium]